MARSHRALGVTGSLVRQCVVSCPNRIRRLVRQPLAPSRGCRILCRRTRLYPHTRRTLGPVPARKSHYRAPPRPGQGPYDISRHAFGATSTAAPAAFSRSIPACGTCRATLILPPIRNALRPAPRGPGPGRATIAGPFPRATSPDHWRRPCGSVAEDPCPRSPIPSRKQKKPGRRHDVFAPAVSQGFIRLEPL